MENGQMTNPQRIEALEETVAFQERIIEELSSQVADQWTKIDQLKAKLDTLTLRFLTLEEQSIEAPANTKPPHY